MLQRNKIKSVEFDKSYQPTLCVVIDTEEDFDWTKDFSREATSTASIAEQYWAQEIYEKYRVIPTYVMDYCVVNQETSAQIMQDLYAQNLCDIGAHLHPWVNPPFEEKLNRFNGYHGNLPLELERSKLKILTEKITDVFGVSPKVFKAGRYGVGPNTSALLKEFNYQIDCSIVPHRDVTSEEGPNFIGLPDQPYWFGESHDLLEVPLSRGFFGPCRALGPLIAPLFESTTVGRKIGLQGAFSKLKMFDVCNLTPEAFAEEDLLALLRTMVGDGHRVLTLSYHSSSLGINGSPYVKSKEDRKVLLKSLDRILDVFMNELGGRIIPIAQLYDELKRNT
jgi:hypothetical protein